MERLAIAGEKAFGRSFELFEAYVIKNVLSLPPSFIPPHERSLQSLPPTTTISLEAVAVRVAQAKAEAARLEQEAVRLGEEEAVLTQLEQSLSSLTTTLRQHNLDGLAMASSTLVEQLQTLYAICRDTLEASANIHCAAAVGSEGSAVPVVAPYQQALDGVQRRQESLRVIQAELARLQAIGTVEDLSRLASLVK